MSNIYIQEPPTEGKVLLVTTVGELDIELWSKEAPKACRNFVQLCLEGYYDGTIFHRVVPGFIVQGGDPAGTGSGGESIYGKPFRDEFHTRLRFTRRGLAAMANAGPNDNGSQFFFTLGACPELQNKHTIFAKVSGNTIYNLPRFEEGEFGKEDRPEFPHKILSTKVLKNPFADIVPREVVKIENEVPKHSKKKKGTKNFKLLSFGDEAEEDEEEVVVATKKMPNKSNSAHDIAMDPTLSSSIDQTRERQEELKRIREKLHKERHTVKIALEDEPSSTVNEPQANGKEKDTLEEIKRSEIRAEIRKLKRELKDKDVDDKSPAEEESDAKKHKGNPILVQYYKDKSKYEEENKKLPKKGQTREKETLALLERFSNKVKDVTTKDSPNSDDDQIVEHSDKEEEEENEDDDSWLTHRLLFDESLPALAKDANTKDDHWYDITDPRNALTRRRRGEDETKRSK